MRKPTSKDEAFQWWRDALIGVAPPPINEQPECGFYKRRLVKGGPWVPAAIWIEAERDSDGNLISDERVVCVVNGRKCDPVDQWGYLASQPISEVEYRRMVARVKSEIRSGDYEPWKPINLLTVKPPTFKREK